MSDATPAAVAAAFSGGLLLVCRDCRHRSNGPEKTKPKDLTQELKRLVRLDRPRPRVLLTSCLGLCPRHATAVARIGATNAPARIAAVTKVRALAITLPMLTGSAAEVADTA